MPTQQREHKKKASSYNDKESPKRKCNIELKKFIKVNE